MFNNQNTIIALEDYDKLCAYVAERYIEYVRSNPEGVIGFFTGSTPIGVYAYLVRASQSGRVNFSKITCVNLDERYPIDPNNRHSFHFFMKNNFFQYVKVGQWFIPSGIRRDRERIKDDCALLEERIKKLGGIGLQGVGMGSNGHVGYNEPGSSPHSRARHVILDDTTVNDAASEYEPGEHVHSEGVTLGIGTVMESGAIIQMGSNARKIGQKMCETLMTKPTILNPSSLLKSHKDLTFAMTMEIAEIWMRNEAQSLRRDKFSGFRLAT